MARDEKIHATNANGREFRYLESGDGPAVVLWHGFPDLPHTWDATRAALVDAGYRTIAPYLRGYHPDTIVPGLGYGGDDLARDGLDLLDALDLDAATVIGHDWGAAVTYGLAELAPERLRGIGIVDIPHPATVKPTPQLAWAARHFVAHKMPWADRSLARNDFARIDHLFRRWSPNWHGAEREAAVSAAKEAFRDPAVLKGAMDYYRALSPSSGPAPRLEVPALVVGGGDNPATAAAFATTAEAFAPSHPPQVEIIADAGHWAHRENESRWLAVLLPWLEAIHHG